MWLEELCPISNERNRTEASAHKLLLLRTQPAAGFGFVLFPLTLLSTTSLWHPIIGAFLSLHLPSLSHLALFLSLFPVSLLSFPPFYTHHLDFTIPISYSLLGPRWLIVYATRFSFSSSPQQTNTRSATSRYISYHCETGLESNAPRT